MTRPAPQPTSMEDTARMAPTDQFALYTGIVLYSTQDPEASAMLVDGDTVAWVGPEDSARVLYPELEPLDFEGCLLTPSFVDAAPTADGSAPDPDATRQALTRGVTAMVPGPAGQRDGMRVIAPLAGPAPYLDLTREGTALAFGSLGEAAAASPWSWVHAAGHTGPLEQRISDRAAFLAATRGGRRLAGRMHPGALNPGVEATFVVWEPWDLTVRGQDERIQTWSTDPRSRTPMLPDLSNGAPRALRTVVEGRVVHETGARA